MRMLVAALLLLGLAGCRPSDVPRAHAPESATLGIPTDASAATTQTHCRVIMENGVGALEIAPPGVAPGESAYLYGAVNPHGEEEILRLPSPLAFDLGFGGDTPRDFEQTMDYKTGLLTQRWRAGAMLFERALVAPPTGGTFAERFTVSSATPFVINAVGAQAMSDLGSGFPQRIVIAEPPDHMQWTDKGVVFKSVPMLRHSLVVIASTGRLSSEAKSFEAQLNRSKEQRAAMRRATIHLDGPVEDQLMLSALQDQVLTCVEPGAKRPPSPFGAWGGRYHGHVFWDADTWLFPALALIDPERARIIPEYRLAHEQAASAGQALRFPWESSLTGKETAIGDGKDELHVTGDVAWMLDVASALGIVDRARCENVVRRAADFYRSRTTKRADGLLEWRHVIGVDEGKPCSNDLYTNLLAQWLLSGGDWRRRTVYIPHDDKSWLSYDGDPVVSYKQSSVLLALYPLQEPEAERSAKTLLARFLDKTTPNGPAMSDPLHVLLLARYGDPEDAYALFKRSLREYMDPLGRVCEYRMATGKRDSPFVTGAAIYLQSVVYGFLGFRIDSKPEPGAAWSLPLQAGKWLSVKPRLPREWKTVYWTFRVQGHRYELTASHEATRVREGD